MAEGKEKQAEARQVVRYVGLPPYGTDFLHAHSLEPEHLKHLGDKEARKGVVWDKANEFTVDAAELHPDVLARLAKDPAFKVENA